MMQTAPGHATAYQRMIHKEPGRLSGAEFALLTPAERIALTIALLNHGLDLMNGLVRASFAGWRRGLYPLAPLRSHRRQP